MLAMAPLLVLAGCGTDGHAAQDAASGQAGRRDFQVGAFDRVELAGSQDVIVTVGGAPSVRAEGDTGIIDKLDIRVEDGALKIGQKKGSWSFGWKKDSSPVTIYVSAPALRGAQVTGSGDMRVDKVQADSFSAAVTGSGELDIAALQAKSADFAVTGSGEVRAVGAAETANLSITGSGDLRAGAFEVKRANVSVMGSGNVEAKAMETADVSIMGSGDATITGTARCNIEKKGSGDARCGG
jgi:hypothetical protein